MRIARDGTWFHQGTPIGRLSLVQLFARLLRKDDDGFMLVTPVEKLSIAVEDAPFIAVALEVEGTGQGQRLMFRTNMGDMAAAGAAHGLRFAWADGAPIPYLDVRRGLEARLARPVYYQLMDLVTEENGAPGVWSEGVFFPLSGT